MLMRFDQKLFSTVEKLKKVREDQENIKYEIDNADKRLEILEEPVNRHFDIIRIWNPKNIEMFGERMKKKAKFETDEFEYMVPIEALVNATEDALTRGFLT